MLSRLIFAATFLVQMATAVFAAETAEPNQVSPAEVQLLARPSQALLHTSLDGFPVVPEGGIVLHIQCTIAADGSLSECKQECACTEAETQFGPVALRRATAVRVDTTSKRGEPIAGKRLRLDTIIHPLDRFTNATVDFSRSDQLTFDRAANEAHPRYPSRAFELEQQGIVDLGCIVQPDLSAICPDVRVMTLEGDPRPLESAFVQASQNFMKRFHFDPITKDGKSAVGTGFLKRFVFKFR